jgi:2'-5' RNA ligase
MSQEEKRLFVSVPVPRESRAALARDLRRVELADAGGLSWVRPEGYHLTVKFFGGVAVGRIPPLVEALAVAAEPVPVFSLFLSGVGAFPTWGAARVVWAGVGGDLDHFRRLAGRVDRLCGDIGFPRETREARRRGTGRATGLREAFAPMASLLQEPFPVEEIHLMESRLLPGGAAYAILDTFTLRGERR